MLVAEELDCAWAQVRYEHAAPHKIYGNIEMFLAGVPFDERDNSFVANSTRWGFARFARYLGLNVTAGSSSMRDAWVPMRAAGAAARDMLLRAGAARMQVPPAACTTERGVVRHA